MFNVLCFGMLAVDIKSFTHSLNEYDDDQTGWTRFDEESSLGLGTGTRCNNGSAKQALQLLTTNSKA